MYCHISHRRYIVIVGEVELIKIGWRYTEKPDVVHIIIQMPLGDLMLAVAK